MKTQSITLSVSTDIGTVSGEYMIPEKPICIMTLAHGAGANMHHSFMVAIAESLAQLGIATLRFNFPFTEHKKGRPDQPAVAHKTIAVAIEHAHQQFPSLPLFVSGKSFGGRMSSQYIASQHSPIVKGLVFFGFPLHPPRKPSVERAVHLKDVKVPMLFLQGTKDELATFSLIEEVCKTLPLSTLVPVEGADHAFKAGKRDIISILANACKAWIERMSLPESQSV